MKAVILAGGYGTRLMEESVVRPKPMVEIGGKPVLWHIMKIYSHYGINDFIICLGYKGYVIKEYFANYFMHMSDLTFDLQNNAMEVHNNSSEPWRVTLIDTGEDTLTGGRIKQAQPYLNDEPFCMTYGDGVADININKLVEHHINRGKLATLTAVQPPGRFGSLMLDEKNQDVDGFCEKPIGDGGWINGGFFVISPKALDYIKGPESSWEGEPVVKLATDGQLAAYKHSGFWQPMDTLRDKNHLQSLWANNKAPWKLWK